MWAFTGPDDAAKVEAYERQPMFTRVEPDGVRMPDGTLWPHSGAPDTKEAWRMRGWLRHRLSAWRTVLRINGVEQLGQVRLV